MSDFFNLDFLDGIDIWDVVGAGVGFLENRERNKDARTAARQQEQTNREYLAEDSAQREPYRALGGDAANKLRSRLTGQGLLRPFSETDFTADPGYNFRLNEGLRAQRLKENAGGGLYSSAALRAAERYGQGLASQEYDNAYRRYNNDQRQQYNFLAGAVQPGIASFQNMYPAYSSIADAEAAGTVGSNSWSPWAAAYNAMDERRYANTNENLNNFLKQYQAMV